MVPLLLTHHAEQEGTGGFFPGRAGAIERLTNARRLQVGKTGGKDLSL